MYIQLSQILVNNRCFGHAAVDSLDMIGTHSGWIPMQKLPRVFAIFGVDWRFIPGFLSINMNTGSKYMCFCRARHMLRTSRF